VRLPLVEKRTEPAKLAHDPEEILARASALFRAEQSKDLRDIIAEKIKDLRHYDVLAMETVVAVLMWGRSGSLLLSSYLDGHDNVIMLPESCGQRVYEFFERYRSLSLRDKLIAYPAFEPEYPRLFEGKFAISSVQYYAAVQAILEFFGSWPREFLESRRAFFLFVHIACNLALGRRPASSHPLIVYAQHVRDDAAARHLVEDFPQAKFVHTVRDPISSCDGVFHYHLEALAEYHILLPHSALYCLANKDMPHSGMESRTRTIRFEDLHSATAETMCKLADWLGLSYQPTLLDSTFNGIPYVISRDGVSWSGRRLEQVQRHSWHFSLKDRALMFALFYENFVEWNYPCPKIFRHRMVRCAVFASLFLLPMKMEMVAARAVFKRRILPSLRQGNVARVIKSLFAMWVCRQRIIGLLAPVFFQRCASRVPLLQVDHDRQLPEPNDVGAGQVQETR
jgi:hypothetical protein